MKNKRYIRKRVTAAALSVVIAASLTACGTDKESETTDTDSYVWVPSYQTMTGSGENTWFGEMSVVGDRLYYSENVYNEETGSVKRFQYLDLLHPDTEPVVVLESVNGNSTEEEYSEYVSNTFAVEGGVIQIVQRTPVINYETATEADWDKMRRNTTYQMKKLGEDGTELFNVDITQYTRMDEENSYLQYTFSGSDGSICLSNGSSYMWVFDKDGNHVADIKLNDPGQGAWINAAGVLPDGRLAIIQDDNNGPAIKAYEENTKSFSTVYKNLPPNSWNTGIGAGFDGKLLIQSQDGLYQYDLETQTYEELVKWIDCDINPDYIEFVSVLSDGRIFAHSRDWNSNEDSLIFLTKTKASEIVQKEILTLGTISLSQSVQSAVVNFNKNSEKYRIEIKDYTSTIDWSKEDAYTTYQDAITRFNNDILTGNAPDMFTMDNININMLASKGVVEDLTPYLEKSTVVKRSDLFESVLQAYTKSDVLCAIPSTFSVYTLVGRTAEVGEQPGWTMDEMLAYAEQYPEATLFPYANKSTVLQFCLMFDIDSYVNWETGECNFDTPEFKKVLELAAKYPDEADYETSEPKQLGNHEALLQMAGFSEAYDWQLQGLMFNEPITAIGFPSSNSTGVMVSGQDSICISSTSKNKEAAWSFLEGFYTKEAQEKGRFMWGFSIRKDVYEAQMEEAMTPNYVTDMNGDPVLDENGEPIEQSNHSYGWDDVTFEIMATKPEEKAQIDSLIESIGGMMSYDEQWMNIVTEETESYFAGQKTVDEVADIIQSRIKIYVNESR